MAQEDITIKLPGSGGEAVIRGFVKNKDRKAIKRLSLLGTEVSPDDIKDDVVKVKLKAENMVEVSSEQVRRLLISYDGDTENPYEAMLESKFEEDMDAVEEAAQDVFGKGGDDKAHAKKLRNGAKTTNES